MHMHMHMHMHMQKHMQKHVHVHVCVPARQPYPLVRWHDMARLTPPSTPPLALLALCVAS